MEIFSRALSKFQERRNSTSEPSKEKKCYRSLEILTQKLGNDLAEEVKSCWIDPKTIVIDKYLGHGQCSGSNIVKILNHYSEDATIGL